MQELKEIGQALREKREGLGYSRYRVYMQNRKLTIPQIKSIEEGSSNYTICLLLNYCNVLGIKLSDIKTKD